MNHKDYEFVDILWIIKTKATITNSPTTITISMSMVMTETQKNVILLLIYINNISLFILVK